MGEAFGDRFEVPKVLEKLVKEGSYGKKSGRGFYRYESGRAVAPDEAPPDSGSMISDEIAEHLANLMVEESRRCLDEGVVSDPDDIDLAMILGTGFAPFRGGPATYGHLGKPN